MKSGLDSQTISESFGNAIKAYGSQPRVEQRVRLGATQRDCMEVMCRWRRDRRFLDEKGLPRALPENGSGATFQSLCDVAASMSDAVSVRATLEEFGAIEQGADGLIRPLTPTFLLGNGGSDVAADGLLKQLAAFLRVVDHNTSRDGETLPRFERICTVGIASELLPVFERTVRERGQEFIDGLDEWLERHRGISSSSETYVEVGAGAYFVDLGIVARRQDTDSK